GTIPGHGTWHPQPSWQKGNSAVKSLQNLVRVLMTGKCEQFISKEAYRVVKYIVDE
ncbi:hypothetical protein L9F63_008068, partial [Diploptera punctata]